MKILFLKTRAASILLIVVLLLSGCKEQRFVITGKLVIPMATDVYGIHNLYEVDLKSPEEATVYFEHINYDSIRSPYKTGNGFICVAKNIKSGYNVVLEVINNDIKELYKTKHKILFPILDDDSIIMLKQEGKEILLINYNIKEEEENILLRGLIDTGSRPILMSDGSILITEEMDKSSVIKLIKKDGTVSAITNGRYPLWLQENKKLLYYERGDLFIFDTEKNKSKIFKRDIVPCETPVISPDNKFIVFYEDKPVSKLGSETAVVLTMMDLHNKQKMQVKAYSKSRILYDGKGILWLE